MKRYLTSVNGIVFPALPPPQGAALLAVLWQLEDSQWWPAEQLRQMQQTQLLSLLNHASETTPFYKQRLSEAGYRPGQAWDDALWTRIPILKRQQLQQQHEALQSNNLPKDHGEAYWMRSSGSTGRPVQVLGSGLTRLYWDVATIREHLWHERDFMQKFAAVRPDRGLKGEQTLESKEWGAPVNAIFASGPSMGINSREDVQQQLKWLQEFQPAYLLSLPSNLREILRLSEQQGIKLPSLKQVRSFGETVTPQLRESIRKVWGVGLTDIYSSQEVGYIALQCPEHEHYHVQSETMYLEVLDENDQPCTVGEIGRVVVTSLHNFAMPLIRYEVGDYAEVGEPCSCGRGLPVLKQVVGRSRNMVRTPEGKCYWPSFPVEDWLKTVDIQQFQLRQTALDSIELHLAIDGELDGGKKEMLQQKLHQSLNYPFKITIHQVSSIPVQENGKYEDFISML